MLEIKQVNNLEESLNQGGVITLPQDTALYSGDLVADGDRLMSADLFKLSTHEGRLIKHNLIDWSGSVSNGETVKIDEQGDVSIVGKAPIGSLESDSVWQLFAIDRENNYEILYAEGNNSYDKKWTDRFTYNYI